MWMRRPERYMDEKSRTMRREELLYVDAVYEVKCYLLQGFHLSLPCFGEETMLF